MTTNHQIEDAEVVKEETDAPSQPTITIQDLICAVRVIDFGAQRGIFPGDQLEQVGAVRTRFENVVKASGGTIYPVDAKPAA